MTPSGTCHANVPICAKLEMQQTLVPVNMDAWDVVHIHAMLLSINR